MAWSHLQDDPFPLPASLLAYIAENRLEHHHGDTGHTRVLQPSPSRSVPADVMDQEPSIFRSFALLHPERHDAGKQPGPGAPALLPNLSFRHRSGAGPREHSLNRPSGSLCPTSAPEQPSIALHGSARALQHTHL